MKMMKSLLREKFGFSDVYIEGYEEKQKEEASESMPASIIPGH
jgi:hypothetical protein